MAAGITVTSNPDPAQLQSLGVSNWPTWCCGVSTFPWFYDEQETCLLLKGDVTVTREGGEPMRFGAPVDGHLDGPCADQQQRAALEPSHRHGQVAPDWRHIAQRR